jgi:hypothetical protein
MQRLYIVYLSHCFFNWYQIPRYQGDDQTPVRTQSAA